MEVDGCQPNLYIMSKGGVKVYGITVIVIF